MTDARIDKLANLLVNYSVAVKPGEKVMIQGSTAGEPLIKAVYQKVLQAGGNPYVLSTFPGEAELMFKYANDEQLKHIPEPVKLAMSTCDCRIYVIAEQNTKELSSIDPKKMVMRAQSRGELMKMMMQRTAAGEMRWVLAPFPTNAFAQDAEMSLSDYEDFLYNACMPDLDDQSGTGRKLRLIRERL